MSEINKTTFNYKKNALGIFTFPSGSFSVQISGSLGPNSANVFDLGSTDLPWRNVHGTSSWATSASWAPGSSPAGLATGSTYPFTSSWAISASWAPTGPGGGLETGSTYPFTSSWAVSASWAPGGSITSSYLSGSFIVAQSTLPWTSSVTLDFGGTNTQILDITGSVQFTSSNVSAGRSLSVKILASGSTVNPFFPTGWIWLGTSGMPTTLAANKTAMLSLTCFGSANSNIVAVWAAQV
jgi:hypothetical protein